MMNARGFSLIELLVALTVCALLSGAVAGLIAPSKVAFDATPTAIDVQQRARSGAEALVAAVRSRGLESIPVVIPFRSPQADPEDGEFNALQVIAIVPSPSQGRLEIDQPGPAGALTLSAIDPCPQLSDVCGFKPGAVAAITDGQGRFDVFTVASTIADQQRLIPSATLSAAYPAGSVVVEVESNTFELETQSDGSRSLVRTPASGVSQPMIDGVANAGFEAWADAGDPLTGALMRLETADLEDGPWIASGVPDGAYDADLLRLRRIDLWLRIRPLAATRVPDRMVRLSVALRTRGGA
jgi:prepilin-type N-terminal cleavage/methylation domain-containing protein